MWGFKNRYFYLYQHLCAIDDHLSGDLHGSGSADSDLDLPDQHNSRFLPDAGSSGRRLYCLARNSQCIRRLQRRFNEQQHWRTTSMRWLHHRDIYLFEQLRSLDDDLQCYFHGISTGITYARFCQLRKQHHHPRL